MEVQNPGEYKEKMNHLLEKVKDSYERGKLEYELRGVKSKRTKEEKILIKEINFEYSRPDEEEYRNIQREFLNEYIRMIDEIQNTKQSSQKINYENREDLEKILDLTGIPRKE